MGVFCAAFCALCIGLSLGGAYCTEDLTSNQTQPVNESQIEVENYERDLPHMNPNVDADWDQDANIYRTADGDRTRNGQLPNDD